MLIQHQHIQKSSQHGNIGLACIQEKKTFTFKAILDNCERSDAANILGLLQLKVLTTIWIACDALMFAKVSYCRPL